MGSPKFLRPGDPETPFPALSDKYFCLKRLGKFIVISWEVTKRKRPCTNAMQPEMLGNGFLFAVFLVQTLTLPKISHIFRFPVY